MRHPFQVSILSGESVIVVASRSTRERAETQAAAIRESIGNYNRAGVPTVTVTDKRVSPAPADGD